MTTAVISWKGKKSRKEHRTAKTDAFGCSSASIICTALSNLGEAEHLLMKKEESFTVLYPIL